MSERVITTVARLDEDEVYKLERRLAIELNKLTPGETSRVRGPGSDMTMATPARRELEQITKEIIKNAEEGVHIASHAESHPLIPVFKAAKIELPPELKVDHDQMRYDFYSVEVTFSILLPKEQFPLSATLALNLSDDSPNQARRARPIRLFPGRKDIQFFKVDVEGKVGIDACLNFSMPQLGLPLSPVVQLGGSASADAGVKAALVIGPLTFPFRKAALEVKGESDQHIVWRYNMESELSGNNEFKSVLILKIPQEVRSVTMSAALLVVPARRSWLILKSILPELPAQATLPIELA
jgi:hypothetical protein